jgi:hypothetical protein
MVNPVLTRGERWLVAGLVAVVLIFGAVLERRTGLRTQPMTDLGVFTSAAWAVSHGDDLYAATDWHGWHYHYPPLLAILMVPFRHPPPATLTELPAGVPRTRTNTPWGYELAGKSQFEPLSSRNVRFFSIVAVWYLLSVGLSFIAVHALASVVEGTTLRQGLPVERTARRQWWQRRLLSLLVCVVAICTVYSRGQVEIVMLFGLSLAIYLAARGRLMAAGIWLMFPVCIKLLPTVLLWPVWQRNKRLMTGVVIGALLGLVVIPGLALGPARTVATYQRWMEVLVLPSLGQGADTSREHELTGMNATDNQSVLTFIHNWMYHDEPLATRPREAAPVARRLALVIAVASLAAVLAAAGWKRPESPRAMLLLVGLLTGVGLLFNPIVHSYYFLLLLPLVVALVDRQLDVTTPRGRWWTTTVVLVAFMGIGTVSSLESFRLIARDVGLLLGTLVAVMILGVAALRAEVRALANSAGLQEIEP